MPAPSVTYTYSNGTTADADQVNQNFTDLINGLSDGTKDLSINALTLAGSATMNGSVTIGNATGDDLTVTASLASSIVVKTHNTYDIGSTTSALRAVYISGGGTHSVGLKAGTASADWDFTLPTGPGTLGYVQQTNGSGTMSWVPLQTDIKAVASGDYSTNTYTITDNDGFGVYSCETSSTARTITLPTAADNNRRKIIIIKNDTGTGSLTVDGENDERINGKTNVVLYAQYDRVELVCNGTGWIRIGGEWNPVSFVDSVSYGSGMGTVTNENIWMKRLDSNRVKIWGSFKIGTGTTSPGDIILTGLTVNTSYHTAEKDTLGMWYRIEDSASVTTTIDAGNAGPLSFRAASTDRLYMNKTSNSNVLDDDGVTSMLADGNYVSFWMEFSVSEWA